MPYCPDCGSEVGIDDAFCRECGTDLEATDETDASQSAVEASEDSEQPDPDLTRDPATTTPTPDDGGDGGSDDDTGDNTYDTDWGHVGIAVVLALVPTLGAYFIVGVAANGAIASVFFLALVVFTYLLYQRPTAKAMLGGMCFWLSMEIFLTPVTLLIYTFTYASGQARTTAETAGVALGGFVLTVIAFVVGVPLAIVFYLVSRRLDVDREADVSTRATA